MVAEALVVEAVVLKAVVGEALVVKAVSFVSEGLGSPAKSTYFKFSSFSCLGQEALGKLQVPSK